jgi:hypothetical protein
VFPNRGWRVFAVRGAARRRAIGMKEIVMPAEYHCPTCNETFSEETPEAVLKRAATHNHSHHSGPESLTPELEAALRGQIRKS